MNEKQAIGMLKHHINAWKGKFTGKHFEACELAIKVLEKEVPQKPVIEEWSPARCPNCDGELSEYIGDGYYRHSTILERCPGCNQRLAWEK